MKRLGIVFVSALAVSLIGCQPDNNKVAEKLDSIDKRLGSIEEQLKSGGGRPGAGRPSGPQRPRPDTTSVYAVPIEGSPFVGPEHAKITIVEAFEFA